MTSLNSSLKRGGSVRVNGRRGGVNGRRGGVSELMGGEGEYLEKVLNKTAQYQLDIWRWPGEAVPAWGGLPSFWNVIQV